MNKKKILIHSNWSKLKTGFAKHKRAILRYLFNTGKFEIIECANGMAYDAPELSNMPWKTYGTAPSPEKQAELANIQDVGGRDAAHRIASYGGYGLEKIVKETRADVLYSAEDSWGLDFIPDFSWAKKIHFIPHCTIDSKPLMPSQVDLASKVDKLYLWASFGVELYKKLGYSNVEHLYGCVETDNFFPIEEEERNSLRQKFGLKDSFVAIKTFRNQVRKSVPNLLDGFKLFQLECPQAKAKLILVTSLREGWNIPQMIKERGLDNGDIYFAHHCRQCQGWEIRPFEGHDLNCPLCKSEKTFNTVDIINGVTEEALNLIYNCADVALGVQNSGGLEIPIAIEAKLAGLPALSTNYSCGEDIAAPGRGALPLDYSVHYEFQTNFIKASTLPESICEKLSIIYKMTEGERIAMGKEGREYVLNNLSPEVIGKKLEEIFDAAPFVEWQDSDFEPIEKSPDFTPPENLSNIDFLISIFTEILKEKVDKNSHILQGWLEHLDKSSDRTGVLAHFQNIARQQNAQIKQKPIDLAELLDKDDEGKRIAVVIEQSAGDIIIVNSLMKRFKKLYPKHNIYFFTRPEFFELVEHLPEIHKVLVHQPIIDNVFFMEGRGKEKGYFERAFYPAACTQKFLSYGGNTLKHQTEWN